MRSNAMAEVEIDSDKQAPSLPRPRITEVVGHVGKGLTDKMVAARYETDGWNKLPVTSGNPSWLRSLLQFHQPQLDILLIA